MVNQMRQLADAAARHGWDELETFSGPKYTRRTPATFGTVTESIDVYVTGGARPSFHHAWYTRQTPDPKARSSSAFIISDARYDGDQLDAVLAKMAEEA